MTPPEITQEGEGRTRRYIVDGLRYTSLRKAREALLRAQERDLIHETITRLASEAGRSRRN